jgi:hypothetical protein
MNREGRNARVWIPTKPEQINLFRQTSDRSLTQIKNINVTWHQYLAGRLSYFYSPFFSALFLKLAILKLPAALHLH